MPLLNHDMSRRDAFGAALAMLALTAPSSSQAGKFPPGRAAPAARFAPSADPIFAMIRTAQEADRAFAASLTDLDEDNAEAMHQADVLADLSSDAMKTLAATVPTTTAGLHAMIRHYAEDTFAQDRWSVGAVALAHLARVIEARPPPD